MFDIVLAIIEFILGIIVFILIIYGLYQLVIKAIMRIKNVDRKEAEKYLENKVSDKLNRKGNFYLHLSDFPLKFMNDIKANLSKEEFENWEKRFDQISQVMEYWEFISGLPCYAVKLYAPDTEYIKKYEEIIRTLAEQTLKTVHCFPEVLITWKKRDGDYEFAEILYARTYEEIQILQNKIIQHDKDVNFAEEYVAKDENIELDFSKEFEL